MISETTKSIKNNEKTGRSVYSVTLSYKILENTDSMQKLFVTVKNARFTEKHTPLILLAACVLAFGLFIPQLGYFQDDWNYVYNSYVFGPEGIVDFLNYDGRPFASWVYVLGFSILGYNPIFWHIAALLLRWLTATLIWNILKFIWPNRGWQTLVAALIFTLYPFFTLQPLAVAYSLHWSGYLLYALSVYFMLLALRRRFWAYSLLALLTQVLHLFTLEFYAGIDLLRPVLIWFALSSFNQSSRERFKVTLRQWAPYLAVFILYFIWRGLIYQAADAERNTPFLLTALFADPVGTLSTTINNVIPDLVLILFSSWYKLIQPGNFDFSVSANLYIFLLSAISFGLFTFFFLQRGFPSEENNRSAKHFILVGTIALVLSLLPVYAGGYVIHTKLEPWNSRFSLGSQLGAALIVTGLVESIVKASKTRWVFLSAVFALLIGWHLHYSNDFRWAWDKQVNFYRQLYLRAPDLAPNTAILSEGEIFLYMGDYPTAYGINLLYTPKGAGFENSRNANYWFFPLAEFHMRLDEYLNGKPFATTRAGAVFEGEPEGSIVISFEPEFGQCLWVMRPEYASSKSLSDSLRQLSSLSHVDRIKQASENIDSFLLKYLDASQVQDWCFYYEKADLAFQYEQWDQVIQLWESAEANGHQPENGFEYLPFIEAYARTGDWETAKKMTRASEKTMQGIEPLLCNSWTKLENETPVSASKENALSSVKEDLRCAQE